MAVWLSETPFQELLPLRVGPRARARDSGLVSRFVTARFQVQPALLQPDLDVGLPASLPAALLDQLHGPLACALRSLAPGIARDAAAFLGSATALSRKGRWMKLLTMSARLVADPESDAFPSLLRDLFHAKLPTSMRLPAVLLPGSDATLVLLSFPVAAPEYTVGSHLALFRVVLATEDGVDAGACDLQQDVGVASRSDGPVPMPGVEVPEGSGGSGDETIRVVRAIGAYAGLSYRGHRWHAGLIARVSVFLATGAPFDALLVTLRNVVSRSGSPPSVLLIAPDDEQHPLACTRCHGPEVFRDLRVSGELPRHAPCSCLRSAVLTRHVRAAVAEMPVVVDLASGQLGCLPLPALQSMSGPDTWLVYKHVAGFSIGGVRVSDSLAVSLHVVVAAAASGFRCSCDVATEVVCEHVELVSGAAEAPSLLAISPADGDRVGGRHVHNSKCQACCAIAPRRPRPPAHDVLACLLGELASRCAAAERPLTLHAADSLDNVLGRAADLLRVDRDDLEQELVEQFPMLDTVVQQSRQDLQLVCAFVLRTHGVRLAQCRAAEHSLKVYVVLAERVSVIYCCPAVCPSGDLIPVGGGPFACFGAGAVMFQQSTVERFVLLYGNTLQHSFSDLWQGHLISVALCTQWRGEGDEALRLRVARDRKLEKCVSTAVTRFVELRFASVDATKRQLKRSGSDRCLHASDFFATTDYRRAST